MTHFLVTDENPSGYKLEDILTLIRNDVVTRAGKIMVDKRSEAQHVMRNNMRILGLLTECIDLAQDSTEVIKRAFGPSDGVHPRIGAV